MSLHQHLEPLRSEDVRVTSHELARALAAIRSRRQAEAERACDTIALGEAIRHLGLDITAEELVAEVRAQRDAEAEAAENARVAAESSRLEREARRRLAMRTLRTTAVTALVSLVVCFVTLKDHASIVPRSHHSTPIITLAEDLAYDGTAAVSLDMIHDLSRGVPREAIRKPWADRFPWLIETRDGGLFVRAWCDRTHSDTSRYFSASASYLRSRRGASAVAGKRAGRYPVSLPISRFKDVLHPISTDRSGCEEVILKAD